MSRTGGAPISVFVDGAYIRAVPGYQSRRFEIVMGRVEAKGRPSRHFAATPSWCHGQTPNRPRRAAGAGMAAGQRRHRISDGDPALRGAVMTTARAPVAHILDWLHLSMRPRHVEQDWEGIKPIGNLEVILHRAAFHVQRLRHLLGVVGYVREAVDRSLVVLPGAG